MTLIRRPKYPGRQLQSPAGEPLWPGAHPQSSAGQAQWPGTKPQSSAGHSRRRVLQATAGAAFFGAAGTLALRPSSATAQANPEPAVIERTALADDLHLLTVGGVNVVAQTGQSDGTRLVDGGPAANADALLQAVAGLPGARPVRTLFNTHWHPEQTGLNVRLGSEGARIIAQENTRLWLTTDITYPWDGQHFEPLPPVGQPSETFYDGGELEPGVAYGYLRHAAHTDGDLYVHFRAANVLAVGDGVSGAGWPLVDWWTGGWIGGIVGTLELVLALSDSATRIVPARGRVLGRADVEEQFEMYNVIFERLTGLLNSGRGPDEAVAARPTEEFDARMGPSETFVRRAFESLWAYLSPDA